MNRVTRWSPDTCRCVLEYEWDDALPDNQRTHSYSKVIRLCPEHEQLGLTGKKLYDQVLSENTCKNAVWSMAKETLSSLELGDFTWSFDTERKLKVGFLGKLTANQKMSLRAQCESRFGIGKVEII